jgi:hypothetical protein
VSDSLSALPGDTYGDAIAKYRLSKIKGISFLTYPIQLNRNVPYTPYIRVVIDDGMNVSTPVSWTTLRFLKEQFSADLEEMHETTLSHFNSGISNLPFEKCYATGFLGWD